MNPPQTPQKELEDLLRAFGAGCIQAGGPAPELAPAHASALEHAVVAGQAAWPEIPLDGAAFAFHVGSVLEENQKSSDAAVASAIAALHVADLFLACACAAGFSAALAEFETRYVAPLPLVLRAGKIPLEEAENVCAILREKLLVRQGGQAPRIATYAGRGPLAAWVAISAQRTAFSFRRHEGALQRAHDLAIKEGIAVDLNPELRYMKQRYRDRYIIFDTPPVLPFAEARSLAHLVDGVLFVVMERLASQENVKEAVDSLKGCSMLGVVYNAATVDHNDGRYSYYRGYGSQRG